MGADQTPVPPADPVPRVICTRERPGRLEQLIAAAGFEPVHVPLITVIDVDDDGPLQRALDGLVNYDWLVVTSRHGSDRVGAAASAYPGLRLAAVGTTTARALADLAGRPVDVVPARQNADGLLAAFPVPEGAARVLIAQADRADTELAAGLATLGYLVDVVDAYRTILRDPSPAERAAAASASAVTFASGSAAQAWVAAFGTAAPAIVAAIGPSTAAVAVQSGLEVTHIAADHSVDGLADAVTSALRDAGTPTR